MSWNSIPINLKVTNGTEIKHDEIKQDINALGREVAVITPIVQKSINKSDVTPLRYFLCFMSTLCKRKTTKKSIISENWLIAR